MTTLPGPDFLLAFSFAILGGGVGLLCGVSLTFWIAGVGPARIRREQAPKA
jgi:hypothetical protein